MKRQSWVWVAGLIGVLALGGALWFPPERVLEERPERSEIVAPEPEVELDFEEPDLESEGAQRETVNHEEPTSIGNWIVGRVLDPDGAPVSRARVSSRDNETHTASDGAFGLRVSSETRLMQGRVAARGFQLARFEFTLHGPGEARVEDVVLRRAVGLDGRVVDETGAAVARAEISSWPDGELETLSDENGNFAVDWLAPNSRTPWLQASATGFCAQRRKVSPEEFAAGEFEWTLGRGALVSGFVVDGKGVAVAGARVLAGRSPNGALDGEVWTSADGAFELPRLPAGKTTLWALGEGYRSSRLPIVVPRAGERLAQLELVLERGHYIAGRVVDELDAPVPFARVYHDNPRGETYTLPRDADAAGRFRIDGLPEAPLRLGFTCSGFTRHSRFFAELDRDDALVHMQRSGSLAGRVVDGITGKALDSFRIRFATPTLAPGEATLYGYSISWASHGAGVPFVGTDGAWSTAGAEELAIGAVMGIEALAEGYAPTIVDHVVVESEPDPDALVIELFTAGARVHGQVVARASGATVAGARVLALRGAQGPSSSEDAAVLTDDAGRFEIEGLALGTTTLSIDSPGFTRKIDGPFELRSGEQLARHIQLDAGARVVGHLLGGEGAPLPDERVSLLVRDVPNAGVPSWERKTAANGAFRFDGLLPGEYQLSWIRSAGGSAVNALNRLVILPPDVEEVRVELQPRGRAKVSGTIDGLDAPASSVRLYMHPAQSSLASEEERIEFHARTRFGLALDGHFEFEHVESGDYILRTSGGWHAGSVEVHVPAEGVVEVRLSVRATREPR